MIKSIHLSTLVWGVFIILAAMLALDGSQVTTGTFKPCSAVATVLALFLLGFDKWAWSFWFLHPWFVDRPYLKGTWKGWLQSSYVNSQTQQPMAPIEVYLVVRQTFSAIHLRLITKESTSESLANNIPKGEDGVYSLASVYRNTPDLSHRDRSPIHHGALLLRVVGDPVVALKGEYWTDRVTRGEIQFTEKSDTLHFDFDSASTSPFTNLSAPPPALPPATTPGPGPTSSNPASTQTS